MLGSAVTLRDLERELDLTPLHPCPPHHRALSNELSLASRASHPPDHASAADNLAPVFALEKVGARRQQQHLYSGAKLDATRPQFNQESVLAVLVEPWSDGDHRARSRPQHPIEW